MDIVEEIKSMLAKAHTADVGFAKVPDGPEGLPYAVSIVLPLSDAVIEGIADAPTPDYYHHYRTVNAYIDRLLLETGLLLQQRGYRYLPVPASQTLPSDGGRTHMGRYSHKKAAVLAGLGCIGKSTLFLHRVYGPRVRLGTLFTDCPLPVSEKLPESICGDCTRCADSCPAGAILGKTWRAGIDRSEMLDFDTCNSYMRAHFMKIGRGSVCGLCIRACPCGESEPDRNVQATDYDGSRCS